VSTAERDSRPTREASHYVGPFVPARTVLGIPIPPPGIRVHHVPGRYERWLKPVFDRLVAFALLMLLAPFMSVLALLVFLQMGSPVLFRQRRVGRHGRVFTVYKFRTMLPDRRTRQQPFPGPDRRRTHKHPHDPRLTPIGRFLRKWSLDELPQLFNVLRGEMSLVGPRPELCEIVGTYEEWQHDRHAVKPGITGVWQISARDERMMHEATEFDLAYVAHLSWSTDLRILLATIPSAMGRHPGY